jgi:hypothetical protein
MRDIEKNTRNHRGSSRSRPPTRTGPKSQAEGRLRSGADLHKVDGTFKLKSGEFILDPATGVAEGEILVDATTGESGNAARDKRMHDEVLESNRYPAMFFHPTQIKGAFKPGEATQQLQAQGSFNIHGADHALEMPVKVETAGDTVTATARFTVPYVTWGMKNPSKLLLRVSKQVDIEVIAKGTIKPVEKTQGD